MTPEPAPDQSEVTAFLADAASYAPRAKQVEQIETHGAIVFLAGDTALKVKRAVKLAYLDFSTLDKREAVCRREIEINRPNAPGIYRDVVAVTREADGGLALDGEGQPVEWAVRMARFGQDQLLSKIADASGIDDQMATALAAMVLRAHDAAPVRALTGHAAHMRKIVDSVGESIAAGASDDARTRDRCRRLHELAVVHLEKATPLLERRAAAGLVRRCHGDMHLGNIVLWSGAPQLFDAIEFDENLATIDVLYDLAFLIMDLDRRGQRRAAHVVLDRYISGASRDLDIEALSTLPLFLGLRAAIRAMVAFDRARVQGDAQRRATEEHAADTLNLASKYLEPGAPRLVAVGGLSGTGKTTLAAALAPLLEPAPGALHLRSDILRKTLSGIDEQIRLPASAYTPDARLRVYAELKRRARLALTAGHAVVIDAVFSEPDKRREIEELARERGVRFEGLWLEAPPQLMQARVEGRHGDASDATSAVVRQQLGYDVGEISWHRVEATGEPATVLRAAEAAIGLRDT